jgi:2-methylisocitrate lyase-like PEP mutase family enzyme
MLMTARKDSTQSTESGAETQAEQKRKVETFRNLHIRGNPIVLFNAWDAGSAKAVVAGGAKAIGTSSWSVAAANGFGDGERIPLDLAMNNLRRIVSAVEVPVTVDLESGYGDAPDAVGMTIGMAIEVGAAGCNLEDSFPANGELRKPGDQVDRISCARQVADEANIRFFINARTDVFFRLPREHHDNAILEIAIERARLYAEAGADGLFAPGLVDIDLIRRLADASRLPVNVMVVDETPSVGMLAQNGVARVSYGPRPYLLAMKTLEEAARAAI